MLTLTVPTYRRPEPLYRLLASLGGCEYRDSLEGVFVFDDEEGPNNTAAAVSRVNKEFGLSVQYVGFTEKQLLKEEASAGNRELSDALEFAFWGMDACGHVRAAGMNRNAILAPSARQKIISADDDILFHYLAYKKSERFLEKICARRVYQNIQGSPFFAFSEHDWEEFQKRLVPYTGNPFGEFERVLGASAQQLGYAAYPLEGPIRIAMSGVYGGRWYSSPFAVAGENPLQNQGEALFREYLKHSGELFAHGRNSGNRPTMGEPACPEMLKGRTLRLAQDKGTPARPPYLSAILCRI